MNLPKFLNLKERTSLMGIPRRFAKSKAIVFVVGFAVIGSILLFTTRAATPFASVEVGTGSSVTAPATIVTDQTASGGSAVQFGSVTPPPPVTGFVSRTGTQLTLGGQPYKFTGFNIYNANNRSSCSYVMGTGSALNTALTDIDTGTGSKSKVFRAWFFQNFATSNGARDWAAFDNTIATAKAKGYKIIATLGNQWADCDPAGYKGEQWYQTGYTTPAAGQPVSYRDFAVEIAARYKDEPAILAWQLMNEAETTTNGNCPDATRLKNFATDVSGLIKSADPNHLISLGTIGSGQCGAQGDQYRVLHDVPSIDFCEYHDYGSPNAPMPGDQFNGLQARINQCNSLSKPLFIGEIGIYPGDVGQTLEGRANAFNAKFAAQFNAGVVGELVWEWRNGANGGSALYDFPIGPGDPTLGVLGNY